MFGKQRFLKDITGGRTLVKKPLQTQDFLFSIKTSLEREYPSLYWCSILTEEGLTDHFPNIKFSSIKKNLKSLSLLPAFYP
jgi:hypothetical protein